MTVPIIHLISRVSSAESSDRNTSRRDVIAVLGRLSDGTGCCIRQLTVHASVGQPAGNGERIEHFPDVLLGKCSRLESDRRQLQTL